MLARVLVAKEWMEGNWEGRGLGWGKGLKVRFNGEQKAAYQHIPGKRAAFAWWAIYPRMFHLQFKISILGNINAYILVHHEHFIVSFMAFVQV